MKTMHINRMEAGEKPGQKREGHLLQTIKRAVDSITFPVKAAVIIGTCTILLTGCQGLFNTGPTDKLSENSLKCMSPKEVQEIYGNRRVITATVKAESRGSKDQQVIFLVEGVPATDIAQLSKIFIPDSSANPKSMPMDSAVVTFPGARVIAPFEIEGLILNTTSDATTDLVDKLKDKLVEGDKLELCKLMGKNPQVIVEINAEGQKYYIAAFSDEGKIKLIKTIDAARDNGNDVFFRVIGQGEADKTLADPSSKMVFIG